MDELPELEPADDDAAEAPVVVVAQTAEPEDLDALPELLPVQEPGEEDLDALPELLPVQEPGEDSLDALPELMPVQEPGEDNLDALPELEVVDEPDEPPDAEGPIEAGSFRRIYETRLRDMTRDARIEGAHKATGDLLCAYCLDAEPAVIMAVLENAEVGLKHARLIAEHHLNPVGLDAMGRRAEFLRDATVRRLLLRNIQAPGTLLRHALAPQSLHQVFRTNMGHDNSERARRVARDVLRDKFMRTSAEDRVGLILKTEGRCLTLLVGVTFDQKMTALLCSRTYQSTLLVQSLARFPALPPNLINALFRQQLVQRSPQLKKLLLQHKNCPGQHKR